MSMKVARLGESLLADAALIRSLSRVDAFMNAKVGQLVEALPTHLTLERLMAARTTKPKNAQRIGGDPSNIHQTAVPALPHTDIAGFMSDLAERNGVGANALGFTIVTAVRSGETCGMTWDEIGAHWRRDAVRYSMLMGKNIVSPEWSSTPSLSVDTHMVPSSAMASPSTLSRT